MTSGAWVFGGQALTSKPTERAHLHHNRAGGDSRAQDDAVCAVLATQAWMMSLDIGAGLLRTWIYRQDCVPKARP